MSDDNPYWGANPYWTDYSVRVRARDNSVWTCKPVEYLKYKCGKCGHGNIRKKLGFKCRVCKAKVIR